MENYHFFLQISTITHLYQSLGACFFVQVDPRSFVNSDTNASLPSLKKNGDSPTAILCPSIKLTSSVTSISDGKSWYPPALFPFAWRSWRPDMAMIHLNCSPVFCPTLQPTFLRRNQWTAEFLDYLAYVLLPYTTIIDQSAKGVTIPDGSSFFMSLHFSIHNCSWSFLGLLASWRIKSLGTTLYVASAWTALPASNRATEVEDIHGLWGLYGLGSCPAAATECRLYLVCSQCSLESWAFWWNDNCIESPDRN